MSQPTSGTIKVPKSIMKQAIKNDPEALSSIFSQFLAPDEQIYALEYLGTHGLWGLGTRSFTCLTSRRVASLRTGAFGQLVYQDGFLEHINSGVVYQPSRLGLYINVIVATLMAIGGAIFLGSAAASANDGNMLIFFAVAIPTLLLLLVLFWIMAVRLYYSLRKCGLVWVIREGVSVYTFANRKKLVRANQIYRMCTQLRDERLKAMREHI
jgi:hypothetical protein